MTTKSTCLEFRSFILTESVFINHNYIFTADLNILFLNDLLFELGELQEQRRIQSVTSFS